MLTGGAVDSVDPQISGQNIVFTQNATVNTYYSGATSNYESQIYDYNIGTQAMTQLSNLVVNGMSMPAEHADISGNAVVWHQLVSNSPVQWNAYSASLVNTEQPVDISNGQGFDWNPLVSSTGMVAYSANAGSEYDIFTAYQQATASVTGTINLVAFGTMQIKPDLTFSVSATEGGTSPSATATVTILNSNGNLNYGSAPTPYPTALTADGARHLVLSGEYLGTSEAADNGVVFNSPLVPGATASVTVTAALPAGVTSGKLDAWIDYNDNGSWTDSGEEIFKDATVVAGANTLTFSVPTNALPGSTWMRFRYSQAGGLAPTGMAMDGEVEDSQVQISAAPIMPATGPGSVVRNSSGTVTITGTTGSNVFSFTAGATDLINFDGKTYSYPAGTINNVVFRGGGGQDSAFLKGSTGTTSVSLEPASTGLASTMIDTYNNNKVAVSVYAAQYILATGGGGANDAAQLFDSSGSDTATLHPNDGTLSGTGFSLEAAGFPVMHAYSIRGGKDVVNFGDLGSAVSTLLATNLSAQMSSKIGTTTISNYAQGFTSYYATASSATDQAQLFDYQGQSLLLANGSTNKLYASNGSYLIQVSGFAHVQAFGKAGGNDKATMSDTASSVKSTFVGARARPASPGRDSAIRPATSSPWSPRRNPPPTRRP